MRVPPPSPLLSAALAASEAAYAASDAAFEARCTLARACSELESLSGRHAVAAQGVCPDHVRADLEARASSAVAAEAAAAEELDAALRRVKFLAG